MKYEDEITNEQFEHDLPRYAAGRMPVEEQAAFERALRANPDRQRAAEELRGTARQFGQLLESDREEYTLSAERLADLRAAAKRVRPFPNRMRRFRIASQAGVAAAALIVGAFLGLDQGRQQFRTERGLDRIPVADQELLRPVLDDPSFLYRYPPGYGLDRDDSWRHAVRKPWIDQGSTHPFTGAVLADDTPRPQRSIPYYYGLDGPTPYYPADDLSWGYI